MSALLTAAICLAAFAPVAAAGATATDSDPPAITWSVVPNRPVMEPWLLPAPVAAFWADGRTITVAPTLVHPEPLVMPQIAGTVDPDDVEALLTSAASSGLLAGGQDYGFPLDHGPHAPLTVVEIVDGEGVTWRHEAFGLSTDGTETGVRAALAEFVIAVRGRLPGPPWTAHRPDAIEVRARIVEPSGARSEQWPAGGPDLAEAAECLAVTDGATIDMLLGASASHRFEDHHGTLWQLAARPVLPGTTGC